ncbi:serine/threonine-protein kinase [Chroococcidiopsis sp. TS-821]|uniref:serine/threonine-protein kinase n=1 Tax=Chroococcidiopsis sp. TS-821 TaxID=1378066 RepID=UPI000CEDE5D3|nr:serine/threonine-protein kinase [Chroococcidiopsis sp. TS-821]PPS40612.1 protein kinase [Chroococcidiopsis sp. TS-821]
MTQHDTSSKLQKKDSTAKRSLKVHNATTKITALLTARQSLRLAWIGHILTVAWALAAAIATGGSWRLVQMWESQVQTMFFELRGPVAPPEDIVILAIDEPSLSMPKQLLQEDPQKYAYLEPLKAWTWQRSAYAQVVERLISAGAKVVALDILFTNPSSYGIDDDRQLAEVLRRYPGKVALAAEYAEAELHQGSLMQLVQPERLFQTESSAIGTINFPLEADGKVHRFASTFPKLLAQRAQYPQETLVELKDFPSFEEAVVKAINPGFVRPRAEYINFYGPAGTFEQISFWHVLDPENWNTYLQQGKYFKDKIVLIGATAASLQDFHGAPFAKSWLYPQPMSGVEIQANAIATLLNNRAIAEGIPNTHARSLFILLLVGGSAFLIKKSKRTIIQCASTVGIVIGWISISYFSFIYSGLYFPVAVPLVAIALASCSYLGTGAASERLRKMSLHRSLERYAASPIVQEIISQQDDLQYLLEQRELATIGKLIGGRYKIVKVLGAGGFSETYVAEDKQRPGNPRCVVKQLKLASNNPKHLQLAKRLFQLEAETLEKLGTHDQIPQLLAYFDEGEEFYLVQELVVGHPLSQELLPGRQLQEATVIQILYELLQTLEFVHRHGVIHRDIKPSNIIRRHSDGKLVLIDFGAVKEVSNQVLDQEGQSTFTIGIGTQGYAPSEQCAGRVKFSSDIYALGMTGIRALTGLSPHELQVDADTGEILWMHKAQVSHEFATVLCRMVRHDFTQRYQSASEALAALEQLVNWDTSTLKTDDSSSVENSDTPTTPWSIASTEIAEPSSTIVLPPQ